MSSFLLRELLVKACLLINNISLLKRLFFFIPRHSLNAHVKIIFKSLMKPKEFEPKDDSRL